MDSPTHNAIKILYEKRIKNSRLALLLRYYLDREPTEFGNESIEIVATNLETTTPFEQLKKMDVDCVFFDGPGNQMDSLDGFFYARREY